MASWTVQDITGLVIVNLTLSRSSMVEAWKGEATMAVLEDQFKFQFTASEAPDEIIPFR